MSKNYQSFWINIMNKIDKYAEEIKKEVENFAKELHEKHKDLFQSISNKINKEINLIVEKKNDNPFDIVPKLLILFQPKISRSTIDETINTVLETLSEIASEARIIVQEAYAPPKEYIACYSP